MKNHLARVALPRSALPAALPLAVIGLMLAACGSRGGGSEAAAGQAGAEARHVTAQANNLVTAVSGGKPSAPIELQFDIATRPEAGKPVDVTLSVVPRGSDISELRLQFQSADGIELRAGAEMPVQEHPKDGVALSHTVTIVPQRDGVFALVAMAMVETADGSIMRTFSIPIVVGAPPPADAGASAVAAKPAQGTASTNARGERIVSMPAGEPRQPNP
jgi:hypothetical protein